MKQILLSIIILSNVCYAQTYEEAVDKCIKAFQSGFDPNNRKDMESKMEGQMKQLRICMTGLNFPSFNATTIKHKPYSLEDLKGKVVLINLWFISCPPCVAEIPMFNDLSKEYKDKDFVILSFGLDDTQSIIDFMEKKPMNFKVFANSRSLITNTFKMNFGYPTNVFLNKQGQIVEFKTGGAMDEVGLKGTKAEMKALIERELSK